MHTQKTPVREAVLTGYIEIPSKFRAQSTKVPGVAFGAAESMAPSTRNFRPLSLWNGRYVYTTRNFFSVFYPVMKVITCFHVSYSLERLNKSWMINFPEIWQRPPANV